MANNNQIYKMSNAGGFKSLTRYYDMLAGNTVWNPWEPQGAYDSLATVTVPAGGAASVTFAGIPTGYKHLQIRALDAGGTGSNYGYTQIRVNSDSGSNYTRHLLYGDGSTAQAYGIGSQTGAQITSTSLSAGSFSGAIIDFLDYANITKNKTIRALSGVDQNGAGTVVLGSSVWMNTSAITSITFNPYTTFQQNSQFALFGVK